MSTRLLLPRSQAIGRDGRPLVGAKLYIYVTGTSTAKAVYTDAALSVAHTNPVIADDRGAFPAMFMGSGSYKTLLTDAEDDVIWTDDPVDGASGGSTDGSTSAAMRNRIVNGGMQHSQANGTTPVDCTTATSYVLDQWLGGLSVTPGGTLRVMQYANPTPGGNVYRLATTATVIDATLTADAYYTVQQPIMGSEVAAAKWGLSTRNQVILRFGVLASVAGTYCASIVNSALNRSWVGTFTISAGEINMDVVRSLVIPGDASGTWLTDSGVGMQVRWCVGCGTDFQGSEGWQAGNILATSSQTNMMATLNANFQIFDVGLYIDAAETGTAPAYEQPDPTLELVRCLPFWRRLKTSLQFPATAATQSLSGGYTFSPPMRATPTVTINAAVSSRSNVDAAYPIVTEIDAIGLTASILSAASGDSYDRGRVWVVDARF